MAVDQRAEEVSRLEGWELEQLHFYSYFSATSGSTFIARRAGT